MPLRTFPDAFLWGSATSSHQVEGHTTNDWSEWEKANASRLARESSPKFGHLPHWERVRPEAQNPENYLTGRACDHFNRYAEDFDIAQSLGQNAHRFSFEWSRIEPTEGTFDPAAIEHYKKVLAALHARNIEPFVTLWHWTLPLWLRDKGGIASSEFIPAFTRYAEHMAKTFPEVRFWLTLNEPTSVIGMAYLNGQWPPQKKNFLTGLYVYTVLGRAHNKAYAAIHRANPIAEVGFGNLLHSFEAYHRHSPFDNLLIVVSRIFTNRLMLWLTSGHNDYLTVQYYFHNRFKFPKKLHPIGFPQSDLGWEIYPKGIFNILDHLKRYKLPIYITENGLADATDEKRASFIREHLRWVHQAIQEGADVRGYFYWSLLDNFEWDKGFWPRFGLVEVDRETLERRVRPSAKVYEAICRANALEEP